MGKSPARQDDQAGEGGDVGASFEDAGRALFLLIRLLGRSTDGQRAGGDAGRPVELSRIMVVQAVEAAREDDGPDAEIGVGTVAARLAIDPSTASRLVAETIADGFLGSSPSPTDARRRRLGLTDAGRGLAAAARHHQAAVFAAATAGWPEAERRDFARRFAQFAAAIAERRVE